MSGSLSSFRINCKKKMIVKYRLIREKNQTVERIKKKYNRVLIPSQSTNSWIVSSLKKTYTMFDSYVHEVLGLSQLFYCSPGQVKRTILFRAFYNLLK